MVDFLSGSSGKSRSRMSHVARFGLCAAFLFLLAAVTFLVRSTHGVRALPTSDGTRNCGSAATGRASSMRIGVALGGSITPARLDSFADAARISPSIVEVYRQFGRPFSRRLACVITKRGALLLIDLDPTHQAVGSIASGRYDTYLTAYADEVLRFKLPVAISFGHEMNGDWYSWGWKHAQAAEFIAAWRHIHSVFAGVGANNVIWVWSVSPKGRRSSAQFFWWPGASYVTWVGLDSYYREPRSRFNTIVGSLIHIRSFTHKPVLITETAVAPGRNAAEQVASLFMGVATHPGVLGFVWFDQDNTEPWSLQGDPAAIKVFRREVRAFG